jgi:hypothetical protein
MTRDPIQAFIDRWSPSGGAEHANYQLFLGELCDVFTVSRPDATVPDNDQNAYVFQKQVNSKTPTAHAPMAAGIEVPACR